jgi:hypothetical protein
MNGLTFVKLILLLWKLEGSAGATMTILSRTPEILRSKMKVVLLEVQNAVNEGPALLHLHDTRPEQK